MPDLSETATERVICSRCGHELTRRKNARKPTPHQTNPRTPEGRCSYCRDCFNERTND